MARVLATEEEMDGFGAAVVAAFFAPVRVLLGVAAARVVLVIQR